VNKSARFFTRYVCKKYLYLHFEKYYFTSNLLCNIVPYMTHLHLSNTSVHYLDRYGRWFCWILSTSFWMWLIILWSYVNLMMLQSIVIILEWLMRIDN
jgi:hypothetical protein